MILYHPSGVGNLKTLKPSVSNHNKSLVYFSSKKENVAVYLSNAVERFCKETGFYIDGKCYKWASYGFDREGIINLEEYYSNATEETYKGVSGFIYTVDTKYAQLQQDIPFGYVSQNEVPVLTCQFIPDAYEHIMDLVNQGIIRIRRYNDMNDKMRNWLVTTIRKELASNIPEHYRYFLMSKFDISAE